MDAAVLKIMGYQQSEVAFFQESTRFVNVRSGVIESSKMSAARLKLWNWIARSLMGPNAALPGPISIS